MQTDKGSFSKEGKPQTPRTEINSRGYYSEVITSVDYGPNVDAESLLGCQKKTNLLWQIQTEKHAPAISKLTPAKKKVGLKDAERWMHFEEDDFIEFSVDTFKPKVQLQLDVYPFEMTRSVATERLRREYQSQNINILLEDLAVLPSDMVSVQLLESFHPDKVPHVSIITNYLPLELFDDEEYECRTPENWLELGVIKGARNPLPGEAFVPVDAEALEPFTKLKDLFSNLCQWVNVAVMDYDADTKLWKVLTLDGKRRTVELPRIYVMFKAEDPAVFALRIKSAVDLRRQTENTLRYKFYLNTMLLADIPELEDEVLEKLYYNATRANFIKETLMWNQLVQQVQNSYQLTHCDLQFRMDAEKDFRLQQYVNIIRKEWDEVPKVVLIKTGMKAFRGMRDYFKWMNIYVVPESYRAMYLVIGECLKVEVMFLFTKSYGIKHITLEEFDIVQNQCTNNVINFLQGQWLETIVYNIRMCLGDVGKGWFDINVYNYEIYEVSKLRRFMELIKFRMQYTLRLLVLNSIELFIDLVETPCLPCLEVDDDFVWGPDLIESAFVSKASAIFILQMKMDETCAFYSTPLANFEKVLLKLYDTGLTLTHKIKQIHPYLLKNLNFPSDLMMSSLGLLAEEVVNVRKRFVFAYERALIPLRAFAKEFDIYLELFTLDVKDYVEKFKEDNHTASEVKEEVSFHYRMKTNLEATLPSSIIIGPFFVTIEQLRHFLISKRQDLAMKLLDMFCQRMKKCVDDVLQEYYKIEEKLAEKPDFIETVFEIRDWMETVPMLVRTQEELLRRYLIEYDVLEHFWYALPQEDFEHKWEAIGWPYKITKQVDLTDQFLKEEEERFYKIQLSDEYNIQEKIEACTAQVVQLSKQKDFGKTHEIAVDMRRLWKLMKEAQEQGQLLNQRQKLFGVQVVPFDNLLKLIKEFEPYKTLWITASDWLRAHEMWMENPLVNIDGEAIERTVTEMYKTMVKMVRTFSEIEAVQLVALEIKNQIEEFKPLIPLLLSLRNPGMRPRHWDEFKEQTGIDIQWTPALSFKDCLDLGVADYSETLVSIADSASKEYGVEHILLKMMDEWENCTMELTPYKDTGTFIMKIPDETQQMLDDHLVLTQQISFSPFKGPFEGQINEWEENLRTTSDVIDEWMDVQKQWMYLEPILTSEDIRIQLPAESKKYSSMERTWRRIMRGAKDNPYILKYCADRKLYESLKDANHILEIVQKGLTDYLETKRMVFPRLYFLSDDELLEILSHAKNPLAVQPHLRKCFENIARLQFEADMCITKMFSAEDECVDLNPTLYPTASVERWLLLVEISMKNTVRLKLGDSLLEVYKKPRAQWVLEWPGQIVIAGSQTFWTAGVENGITTNTLGDFLQDAVLVNLDALRGLVRGSLSFLHREVLSALIVVEVHSRDVTQKLVNSNITNINDFDWISQLRYYWVEESDLKVRAVNAEFQYGYEYLGNSGRLVITPLTDRCYLTLTGALHLKFGGAPAGPAGTGKTETTKDLAKAMALQCVVFNCSDQLDFMAMGKFFKGLASSGAWACFDEFNRIDIEVLSVVAQQITTIQKAQQARLEMFLFEGSEIQLKQSCAVFITMNPGYAGRTELPDNLKALFRPVSMMVPDYTLISEISLFSFGFGNAKLLANKITTTFKLSSEQLSSQDHYDFGMRAVKTVIAVAGNLKREKPEMNESQIVLRALRDVNVPKFLKDDLKLFNGIVSDLFPKMVEEPVDYGVLEESIRFCCIKAGLEDVEEFVRKVIQLYETTIVRHGLMLVGPTASGKTKCYEILKTAITRLEGQLQPSGNPFRAIHTYVLNPKAITMGQLYGEFDAQTHEWTDGILPCLVRSGISAEDKDKRWYIFDGPVDAVWIENMNSVLDDNKKLCLSSGEIIKLRDTMIMMFEVADLAVASPATVSRCGMVYLEPGVLGLEPFINCWIRRLPPLAVPFIDDLKDLIYTYVIPGIDLVRNRLREILTSVDSSLLCKFLRLMDSWIGPLTGRDNKPPPASQFLALIPQLLVPWVVFSLVWSVGCTCDNQSRVKFDRWLRETMRDEGHSPRFPAEGLVYDYRLHDGGFTDMTEDGQPAPAFWYGWMQNVEEYVISVDMRYSDMEIPTMDNVRNAKLLEIVLNNYDNVLCVGPTGTGKTLTVVGKLGRSMHKKFICDFLSFSARTSANQTQDLIDSKLDRRRKGVFGPPVLKRQIIFIDDFNMPALEVYGAQPPIELIRQFMDFSGWYDRRNIGEFRTIIDTNFCVAMGPPEGGRNPVTARLLRHFHYLAFIEMEDDSKRKIFGTILKFWIDRIPQEVSLADYYTPMLEASIDVYNVILKELLPTPAKTHYTFNLRDLSKIFQGILMFNPEKMTDVQLLVRLWYHESCRVFQDRLVSDDDRNWFAELLKQKIKSDYKVEPQKALGSQMLFFADFTDPSTDFREYVQITDAGKLSQVLDHYLNEYNEQSTRPMKLVLFLDAISHVCRISRIIRQPLGNALLLGVGGSGRQSLTRLATFMAEYFCFQIEIHKAYGSFEWREDLKGLMLKAGLQNRETVFLFSDTQIKSESFLEDLNNVLNSGDVPNIYQPEELDRIYQDMKGLVQEMGLLATKSNLFSAYQKMVRSNLHTVVTMSPIGDIFRARLRQFPALVNCCTIDWFSEWPDSALQSVALQFLDDISELSVEHDTLQSIVMVCQFMHASVVDASVLYKQELSRHNYVTPTSYLELLSSYTDLMIKKRTALSEGVGRLATGLGKLQSTAEEVKALQKSLAEMKPALEAAARDADAMIVAIAKDQAVAEETKEVVEKEELEAAKMALETQTIADDAQRDLDEALPDLMAAEASLKSLNKNDISEVRSMKRPPAGVVYVIEAICIVKNVKPRKVPGNMPGEKVLDYFEPGRAMLADANAFLTSLYNFDKDSITEDMIEKLKVYVTNPLFQPAKVAKVSKACKSLCMWVHAMFKFYFVNKRVAPKKAALATAKATLAETEATLASAKEKMRVVMDNLRLLQDQLGAKIAFKEEKEAGIQICQERMSRAVRLVTGLSDERVRWINTISSIEASMVNVTGDILLSAGAVAYLTPFTDKYRRGLLSEWLKMIVELNIPCSPDTNPVAVLAEPVQIRAWQLDGLPRDYFSTENAVLVSNSKRWPLFIDPQGQANKWVKNMEKSNGLMACKMADKELVRNLESAVRFGKPVLIEGVGVDLDPSLDPVLLRQTFKQAGTWMLKLGEMVVPYDDHFRLYMTTNLPNPHYTPEVCVKVLLVNFTLVPSGLQDQLLALVVMQERPDLEDLRSLLIVGSTQMKQELKEIEDRILYKLSSLEGSPLDDLDFIITLEASKVKSDDIKNKVVAAEITQIDIDNTRAQYIPVANRAQILFFCLSDLSNVDPMYQYSLEWFVGIFISGMAETERSENIDERVGIINEYFTFSLYSNVCRSLFEKHKLHFAFLMCARILMDEGRIDAHEWHHFLAGGNPTSEEPNPASEWLSAKAWKEILAMRVLPNFVEFVDTFAQYKRDYRGIFESQDPHRHALPDQFQQRLTAFQRLLVLKSLRADKVTNGMQDFISSQMGQRFIEPQGADLSLVFKDSSPITPLIFVLSSGTDPAAELYKFADKMKFTKRMFSISLGQGQGPIAEKMLQNGSEIGSWIFFQNCHLAPSFMPRLERLVENISPEIVHRDFRIWLTSAPSPHFPVSILQNGSKMTMEPPRGVKANILRAYTSQVSDMIDVLHKDGEKNHVFKWLLFSLALFHGVLLERRKFGPLGFNIPYEYTDGDLAICISQLRMFLWEYEDVPFKVLTYTAGHINYGGRVTDDWDRRCLMNILADYYKPQVVNAEYVFDTPGLYHQMPAEATFYDYLDYIKTFPINDDPELFGMHPNADITFAQAQTYSCLATLLLLQPKQVGSAAATQEEVIASTASSILSQLPAQFHLEEISRRYPVMYEESLNTVLIQESIRFNRLLKIIESSLRDLLKAIKGLVVMSEALDKMSTSLFSNLLPELWASKAYPSLKPLGAWVSDLKARVQFLSKWVSMGIPAVFWISGFYFPQAFLTATLQNYARKYVVSIDTINFSFKVLPDFPSQRPKDGCCVRGLFLEGARWNPQIQFLDESNPKELYTEMQVVWLLPQENHIKPPMVYECPVYKTLKRAGVLSTTGHSTNYVLAMELPSQKPESHWIKRGVALICALDY